MQKELFPIEECYKKYDNEDAKECLKCGISKPLNLFTPAKPGIDKYGERYKRPSAVCKKCTNELNKLRVRLRELNPFPENINYKCPICEKDYEELTSHGRYTSEYKTQNGVVWHLDHCHTTDTFRGYLCAGCNQGLGKMNDSVNCLKRAIKYLERSINDN